MCLSIYMYCFVAPVHRSSCADQANGRVQVHLNAREQRYLCLARICDAVVHLLAVTGGSDVYTMHVLPTTTRLLAGVRSPPHPAVRPGWQEWMQQLSEENDRDRTTSALTSALA